MVLLVLLYFDLLINRMRLLAAEGQVLLDGDASFLPIGGSQRTADFLAEYILQKLGFPGYSSFP